MESQLEQYLLENCPINLSMRSDIYSDIRQTINKQYPYLNFDFCQVQTMVDAELFHLIHVQKKFFIFENVLDIRG